MKERSSSFFFFLLCSRVVGADCFLGSVLCFFAARLQIFLSSGHSKTSVASVRFLMPLAMLCFRSISTRVL